jgi:hypothetical protein
MFIRSSRFLSLMFPPAVYHGHVLLPLLLGYELLIWSVAHVNARWNMSKHASVHEFPWLSTPATRCGGELNYRISCFRTNYTNQLTNFFWRLSFFIVVTISLSFLGEYVVAWHFSVPIHRHWTPPPSVSDGDCEQLFLGDKQRTKINYF